MSANNQAEAPSSVKKKRAYKNLPLELQDIDRRDISSFVCALELDTSTDVEELRAQKVTKNNVEISLADLNADQLRLLCRRLGITGASSAKRDACRALIAKLHSINSSAVSRSDDPRSVEQQITSTLLRQINVIFSSEFIERFQELNDGKSRVDHETGNIAKKFWQDVTMAYNDFDEVEEVVNIGALNVQDQFWKDVQKLNIDLSSPEKIKQTTSDLVDIIDVAVNLPVANKQRAAGEILLANASLTSEGIIRAIVAKFGWRSNSRTQGAPQGATEESTRPLYFDEKLMVVNKGEDPIIQDMIDEKAFDLTDVDVMTPTVFKKRINLLFRIRRQMKDNMTLSGTHDSNPWNFIDTAMNKIPGGRRLPKVGVLYFYRRCEEYPDVDAVFQPFLDDELKGSTMETGDSGPSNSAQADTTDSNERSSKRMKEEKLKTEAYSSISGMAQFSSKIYDEFQRSNKKIEHLKEIKVQMEKIKIEMEIAKALGDTDRLRELADQMKKVN